MNSQRVHTAIYARRLSVLCALVACALFFATPAEAQNTKGDKPITDQKKPFFRIPRLKSKSKRGDHAYTRDISGRRRIRTKNKSSAARVVYEAPNPYRDRKRGKKGDRPAQARTRIYNQPPRNRERAWTSTRDGSPLRIRSVSAKRARHNVYPQSGPYVNNRSTYKQKHKVSTRPVSGNRIYKSRSSVLRAILGGGSPSASRPYVTRGRKNVYWGKTSKGERPMTKDLTGRPVRNLNFHSAGPGVGTSDTLKRANRRPGKDRANSGRGAGGLFGPKSNEKGWTGDVSGHRIRRRPPRAGEATGWFTIPRRTPRGGDGRAGERLPSRPPGVGGSSISRFLQKLTGRRPIKGGGSVSGKSFNNKGQPIQPRGPGMGGGGIGRFQGNIRRGDLSPGFSREGGNYRGNLRRKDLSNGFGREGGGYRGNIRRGDLSPGFSREGGGYRGNIRRKDLSNGFGREGGGYRGNIRRGDLSPGFSRVGGGYRGNMRARRPPKGGGSISGRSMNNNGRPIAPRTPGIGANGIGNYRGTFRRGDLSPGFSREGGDYRGNLKTRRPPKGGGSISGRSMNNNGNPLNPRWGGPGFDKPSRYQGNIRKKDLGGFGSEGYGYSGNIKAKKPKHGGGSVSGKLWNNNEKPIPPRGPGSSEADAVKYSGKIKSSRFKKNYVQNPLANDASLKKKKPTNNTFLAGGLQVKTKQEKYKKRAHGSDDALKGIGPKSGSGSVKAAEYAHSMKMYWSYKRGPHSDDDALKLRKPPGALSRVADFSGKTRRTGNHRHNPSSNKYALNVRAPGKAYGRIVDFQGNLKMKKYGDHKLHPDAQFAHGFRDNVKEERTLLMNIKLLWSKLFKKNDLQPGGIKVKEHKPRYDKKEKDLWAPLYH